MANGPLGACQMRRLIRRPDIPRDRRAERSKGRCGLLAGGVWSCDYIFGSLLRGHGFETGPTASTMLPRDIGMRKAPRGAGRKAL